MKCRLFNILSAVSLLLWLAVLALWMRSYWVVDAVDFTTYWGDGGFDKLEVLSESGYLHVYALEPPYTRTVSAATRTARHPYVSPQFREYPGTPGQLWSFRYWTRSNVDSRPADEWLGLRVRNWQLSLAAAVLPAIWLTSRSSVWKKWRSRLKHGRCNTCGYDLRASKDRCPECGTAIPVEAASNAGSEHHEEFDNGRQ